MIWNSYKYKENDMRYVEKFAWLPTQCRDANDELVNVWLEKYCLVEHNWGSDCFSTYLSNLYPATPKHPHIEYMITHDVKNRIISEDNLLGVLSIYKKDKKNV